MIQAVIFDCDGVLIDSEVLALDAEFATLAEFGVDVDRIAYVGRFMGLTERAWIAALAEDYPALAPQLDAFHARAKGRYRAMLEEKGRLRPISGVTAAIAALRLPRAVASSSGSTPLRRKLELTGLWDAFAPHVYSGDLVARGKPWPDLYLHAAHALTVSPAACLGIEDSENGVRAARAAGMRVWGFTGGAHCDAASGARLLAAGAERVVEAWPEAQAYFADHPL